MPGSCPGGVCGSSGTFGTGTGPGLFQTLHPAAAPSPLGGGMWARGHKGWECGGGGCGRAGWRWAWGGARGVEVGVRGVGVRVGGARGGGGGACGWRRGRGVRGGGVGRVGVGRARVGCGVSRGARLPRDSTALGGRRTPRGRRRGRSDPDAPSRAPRSRPTGRSGGGSGRDARWPRAPQRPPPAHRLARGLVGLRVGRPRRPPAAARGGTTHPRKPREAACLPGLVVQRGASARGCRPRELHVPGSSAATAGAGGLNGGSPARGGAASAATGAGDDDERGRGPGPEAEAGAAGAGGPAPEAMMGKEEEIARIARRLDKMVTKKSAEGAMDLLRELKAMPVTLHLLQSTRVGMSVNALRKQSSDEEVIALAKSLIKSWKKLLDASDAKAREQRRAGPPPTSSSKEAPEAKDPSRKRPELPRVPSAPRITTFPPVPVTCDAVRNKCREMLTAALQTDHDHMAVGADCEGLSAQIEECIFRDVGNTDMKYKNRVRSRISNLKDAKNPDLRRNVLCGVITPQQIAVMTSEEMASDELKEIRKAMTKEAIREHQMARTGGTQTDLFTCGRCRRKNCTYTQVQTRSSDEPMTTFVVCNECGNRWKFCCAPALRREMQVSDRVRSIAKDVALACKTSETVPRPA
uniref:Opioid related nociceptin receptor 1 n=2 Tax=Canis lupus familiaris TaxID=9615 RepID=A0A8I3S1W3_CANLF